MTNPTWNDIMQAHKASQSPTPVVEAARARMAERAADAPNADVRTAVLVAQLAVAKMGGLGEEPATHQLTAQVREEVEPDDSLWSLWPDAIPLAGGLGPGPDAYVEAVAEQHPDPEVAGAATLSLLRKADARGDEKAARRHFARFDTPPLSETSAHDSAQLLHPDRPIQVGRPMPPLVVGPADDKVDWTQRMSGKVYIVELWGTWCVGCVHAMPLMHETYAELSPRGLELVAFSIYSDPKDVEAMRKTWPMPWQHADVTSTQQAQLIELFGMRFPRTVLVDRDGTIAAIDPPWKEVSAIASKLLDG